MRGKLTSTIVLGGAITALGAFAIGAVARMRRDWCDAVDEEKAFERECERHDDVDGAADATRTAS